MTTAEAWRAYISANRRANNAYYNTDAEAEQAERARAKAVRKAAAQKAYRDRSKP